VILPVRTPHQWAAELEPIPSSLQTARTYPRSASQRIVLTVEDALCALQIVFKASRSRFSAPLRAPIVPPSPPAHWDHRCDNEIKLVSPGAGLTLGLPHAPVAADATVIGIFTLRIPAGSEKHLVPPADGASDRLF
jgi:hypothetical protein